MAGKAAEETLGQRVARLRAAAGLTQFGLAEKAGVPVFSLRSWEQDTRRPRAEAAVRLARALGVTVEQLLAVKTTRPARAAVPESTAVRGLKRLWARATKAERGAFLAWVGVDPSDGRRGRYYRDTGR